MDYTKFDDQVLIRLIAKKDESALGELYERVGRLVYNIALTAIGDHALAEEITQDVFYRVWINAASYRAEIGKVVTWVSGITRNRAIDEIRRIKSRPVSTLAAWETQEPILADQDMDIEEQVEMTQRKSHIRRAIAQLPPDQQQALAYAYYQGYTHSEIADLLGEPLGTVKTRIRLAMKKLKNALDQDSISVQSDGSL